MARTVVMARTVGNGENGGNNLVDGNTGNGGTPGTPGIPGGPGTGQPRQLSPDATLQNLELKDGENDVPLDPAFTSDNIKYAASVESHVTQVTVIPTPTHPQAQVTYLDQNNRVLTDASDSDNGFQVETVAGDTVINVKVTAEDGSTMETYRVTVTRPPSSDATLRNLVLSHGTNVVPWRRLRGLRRRRKRTRQTFPATRPRSRSRRRRTMPARKSCTWMVTTGC